MKPHSQAQFSDEGSWSSWGVWGSCSTSCGQGTMSRTRGHSDGTPCSGSDTDSASCQGNIFYSFHIIIFLIYENDFKMKDHGQVGVDGDHARQVVVKAPRYAHVSTVVGHHAQGVQQTQGTVKVYSL